MDLNEFSFLANGELLNLRDVSKVTLTTMRLSDCSFDSEISLIEPAGTVASSNWYLFCRGELLANSVQIDSSVGQPLFDKVKSTAIRLADDRNEIWPNTHFELPNSKRERTRDPGTDVKQLLDQLASDLNVLRTPVDHNKVGCKKNDVLDLAELHVDRFAGMRSGVSNSRRRVSRHFLNLGDTTRHVLFAVMPPDLVDLHVPDVYSPTYLDALVNALDRKIDVLWVPISPRLGARISGVRYLASHLLHAEYGYAGDFCAVVNSDSELRREVVR